MSLLEEQPFTPTVHCYKTKASNVKEYKKVCITLTSTGS